MDKNDFQKNVGFLVNMRKSEGAYFFCQQCRQKPAYRSQEKLDLHRESFHGTPNGSTASSSSESRELSRKKTHKLSDLLASRKNLKNQLEATRQHVTKLETVSGEQEHTIKLVKKQIDSMEKDFNVKNAEIQRLQRIQKSIIRIEKPTTKTVSKFAENGCGSQDQKNSMGAEYLALMDSMSKVTGLDFKDSKSTASQDIRECEEYKSAQISSLEHQIEMFTKEVKELKQNHGSLKIRLMRETAIKEDIKRMFEQAQSQYNEKEMEVQECRKQINILEKQIVQDKRVMDRLTSELKVFQQKYKEFKEKATESQSLVEKLHDEISKSIQDQSHKELENDELRIGVVCLKQNIEEKEKSIELMRQSEKILKLKINRLTMDLEDINTKEQNEDFKVNQVMLQFQGKVEALEMVKEMVDTSNIKLRENLKVAGKEEDALKKKIRELEKERLCILRERNNLKRELDKSKRHFDELGKHFQRMKKSNKESSEEKKKMQVDKNNLQRELQTTKEELEKMKTDHEEANNTERAKIVAELETRKSNLDGIRKDLNKATKCQLRDEEKLRGQIERLRKEIKDREALIKKMEKESKDVQNTLFQTIHELREKCQLVDEKTSDDLEREVENLKTGLEEAKKVISEQREKFDKLKELHLNVDTELIRVSNINVNLKKERDIFKKQFEKVSEENNHISKEFSKLESRLKESKASIENENQQRLLIKQFEDAERSQQEIIRTMQQDVAKKEKDFERSEKQLYIECTKNEELEKKLKYSDENVKMLTNQIQSNQNESEEVKNKLMSEMNFHQEEIKRLSRGLEDSVEKQNQMKKEKDFERSEKQLYIECTKNEELEKKLKYSEENVKMLTNQIQSNQNESEEVKNKLISEMNFHQEEIKRLTRGLEDSVEKQNQMKKENESKFKDIEESKQVMTKEKENLAKRLIHSEATQVYLSNRVAEMTSQLSTLDKLKKDFANVQSEKAKLEIKMKEIEQKGNGEDSSRELNKLRGNLMSCQSEKDKAKTELKESLKRLESNEKCNSKEIEKLSVELKKCSVKLEESLEETRLLQHKLDEAGNDSCSKVVEHLKEQLQDCQHDKHQLKIELEESLGTQRALQIKVDELIDDAECEGGSDAEELSKQLIETREEKALLDKQLKELQEKLDDTSSNEKKEKDALSQQIEQNKQVIDSMKRDHKNDRDEIQSLKNKIESATQKFDKTNKELDATTKKMEQLKGDTVGDYKEQIKKLSDQLVKKRKEVAELSDKTNQVVKRENQLAKDQRQTEHELCQTQNKLTELKAENDKLKANTMSAKPNQENELSKVQKEMVVLKEKYNKESRLLEIANEELNQSHKRLKELKESASQNEDKLLTVKAEFKAEMEIMKQNIRAADYEYFILKKQYEKDMASKGRIPDAENKALELKKENENLEDDNYQLRLKIERLEKELEQLRSTKPEKQEKADIDWNAAFRSYSPPQSNKKLSFAHDEQVADAKDSEESLNLRVPSQMGRPTMCGQMGGKSFLDAIDDMVIGTDDENEESGGDESAKRQSTSSSELPEPVIGFEIDGQMFDFTTKKSSPFESYDGYKICSEKKNEPEAVPFVMNAAPIATPLTTVRQASPRDFLNKAIVSDKPIKKKKKKMTQELAPLSGVLPPTSGNNLMKMKIPSIQKKPHPISELKAGNQTKQKNIKFNLGNPLDTKPLPDFHGNQFDVGLHSNPLDTKPLPGLHSNPLGGHSNPLDTKPLPGLHSNPLGGAKPFPGAGTNQPKKMKNKTLSKMKPLGPMKRMPGPNPESMKTMMQWGKNIEEENHQQFDFKKEYAEDEEEDLSVLVKDLQKTNAELEHIQMMQQQFYR